MFYDGGEKIISGHIFSDAAEGIRIAIVHPVLAAHRSLIVCEGEPQAVQCSGRNRAFDRGAGHGCRSTLPENRLPHRQSCRRVKRVIPKASSGGYPTHIVLDGRVSD
jgi:hypothetical protein